MTDATHPGKSPRTTWGPVIYVVVLLSLWCGLLAVVSGRGAVRVEDLPGVLVLAVLALVSAVVRDNGLTGAAHSFTAVISLTCLPLFGPTVAGIIGLAIALLDRTAGVSIVRVFNAVMLGVITLSGGLVYLLVGGVHPVPSGWSAVQLLVRVGLPLLAADLTMCLVNVLVLAGMIAITGSSPRQVLAGTVRELVPLFVAYALIAFLFVLLWGPAGVGPVSAVLIAAPLAIAHFVYVQYGDEMRAHQRIVGMFTRAGDGPDGRVAAHAARVNELCQLIAGQLGLPEHDRQTLGYAAHLHDVAMKAVVRATDVQRGGSGPYTNVAALVPHPALAAQIVAGVHFLAPASATIRAHHERMDGRGYPDGLVGEQIPLTARVLAVADAFDALTTTHGERRALATPDALAELRLSAGTQLDEHVLDALVAALRGRTWTSHDDPLHEGSWLWDHHTLPAMSDVVADDLPASERNPSSAAEPDPSPWTPQDVEDFAPPPSLRPFGESPSEQDRRSRAEGPRRLRPGLRTGKGS